MCLFYFDIHLLYLSPVTVWLFISLCSTLFLFFFFSLHLTSAFSSFTTFLLLGLIFSLFILYKQYNLSLPSFHFPPDSLSLCSLPISLFLLCLINSSISVCFTLGMCLFLALSTSPDLSTTSSLALPGLTSFLSVFYLRCYSNVDWREPCYSNPCSWH